MYLGSRGKEGYRYYLDVGEVKGCVKISVNHCSLCKSRLSKLLGRGRESVIITMGRGRVKVIEKHRKKDGRIS